ncbi:GNAT family N-acetyltransferase [Planctomicrobium sp. SH661]|uniref:GNAT family N-acetyltransferase n=1 Tax=Planctomicrobium sp. SH661 TaxID=3448124 RepID=UPI003F5B5F78
MYRLRRATCRNDLDYLTDIDKRSFQRPWLIEHWEQALRTSWILVATYWGAPVGFLVARFNSIEASIIRFAVKPNHRHAGLAGTMIQHLEAVNHLKDVTCTVPESWVYADDCKLARFFSHQRFLARSVVRDCFAGEDGVCFVQEKWPCHQSAN